jgi:hypothetical protein
MCYICCCFFLVNIEDTAPILKKEEPVPVKQARVADPELRKKGVYHDFDLLKSNITQLNIFKVLVHTLIYMCEYAPQENILMQQNNSVFVELYCIFKI